MRVRGAEKWYALCEELGSAGRGFTYKSPRPLSLPSLTFRPKPATPPVGLDVVMADSTLVSTPMAGQKRVRDDEGEDEVFTWDLEVRAEKRARPGSGDSNTWAQDSVLNTPTATSASTMQARQVYQKAKYDSDDQSSMMSEPGSPQDITMSDEDMVDDSDGAAFSQSLQDAFPSSNPSGFGSRPWRAGMAQADRVPTPIIPPDRLRSMQLRTKTSQHVRHRHPQENLSNSSDLLDVPSPIDEDEVPTPPSAAEAAGSQLSMLTVNDMDMEPTETAELPRISISPSALNQDQSNALDSAIDMETMDDGRDSRLIVRKQRQRSGALSSGQGSPSPVRAELRGMDPRNTDPLLNGGAVKRVLSMGYRADCEKCRLRVPGHFNHFVS